ncbi:MAG: DNA replication initiation control protein YabA [Lactobacillales bacterium]|jgi:regulator of replication initiation timing|nr:DNA replication initiation control protein YabA [Lactobacillales bacterium]
MKNSELCDSLISIESRLGKLAHELTDVKRELIAVVEENNLLANENEKLRDKIEAYEQAMSNEPEKRKKVEAKLSKQLSTSKMNMKKLYNDKFHICHVNYGSVREQECFFCLDLLHG